MSDRFPGQITIGGRMDEATARALYEALCDAGVGYDYGERLLEANPDAFLAAVRAGGELTVGDDEATYGMFEALEDFCREHGLTYVRHSDAKYEYNAELVWWRPGMPDLGHCLSCNARFALVKADDVYIIAVAGNASDAERLALLKAYLEQRIPPSVPPLEIIAPDAGQKETP